MGVTKSYELGSVFARIIKKGARTLVALDDLNFSVVPGESLGIVGESGSGKSVMGELVVRLQAPTAGEIRYAGRNINDLSGKALLAYRRAVQIVFQNPYDALNPAQRLKRSLVEPLIIHKICPREDYNSRASALLEEVGLAPAASYLERYPHELSGGEVQRAVIARALMLDPDLIVADEPTSMLDVSVRAGLLNLLRELRTSRRQLSLVFISHDFSTIRYICDRTAVMHAGEIVEIGPTRDVIDRPYHPYTKALISAVPIPGDGLQRKRVLLSGRWPDPTSTWAGCRYATRCPHKQPLCDTDRPQLREIAPNHSVACHFAEAISSERDGVVVDLGFAGAPPRSKEVQ